LVFSTLAPWTSVPVLESKNQQLRSNAIQLGVSSGYENFEWLGACQVFDSKNETIVEGLRDALKDKSVLGRLKLVLKSWAGSKAQKKFCHIGSLLIYALVK